jgi:GntR family transcriptional repressor for pyruvate dehydrogenase complex
LAANLRVRRGSLRPVLNMLEIMGVVSQGVGDGTYLNAAAHSMLPEPMEFRTLLEGTTFEELMDARLIVEPELAARVATRASPEQMATLGGSLERMGSEGQIVEDDLRFHRTIFLMRRTAFVI